MFIGLGTVANVATVVVGSLIGLAIGNRLPEQTRTTVTHALGLTTLVIGGLSAGSVVSPALEAEIGGAGMIVVLMSLLLGALAGSWLRIEHRLDDFAAWLQGRFSKSSADKQLFVAGFVTATLVFCVGPLTILGSLSDGLGRGADQLLVKAVLDGFASIAFASTLGVGVLAAAGAVLVIQGSLTLVGFLIGDVLPLAYIDALTAAGGVILLGLGLRLLGVLKIRVGDMLPALVFAPALVWLANLVW